jgi:hypothetical protein
MANIWYAQIKRELILRRYSCHAARESKTCAEHQFEDEKKSIFCCAILPS